MSPTVYLVSCMHKGLCRDICCPAVNLAGVIPLLQSDQICAFSTKYLLHNYCDIAEIMNKKLNKPVKVIEKILLEKFQWNTTV